MVRQAWVPIVLVFVLAFPVASASPVLHADLHADSARFQGARFTGLALFFGATDPGAVDGGARFTLEADAMAVVIHRQQYRSPAGPIQPDLSLPTEPPRESTDPPVHHAHAGASTVRMGIEAFLQAEGLDGPGGTPTFSVEAPVSRLEPRSDLRFQRAGDGSSDWVPLRQGPWPNLEGTAAGTEPVALRGDLTFTLFDADLLVDADDGRTLYRLGVVPQNQTPSSGPAQGIVEEGEVRRADITLQNATLTYWPDGRDYQFNAREGTLQGDGSITFQGADGSLRTGGEPVLLDGARFHLQARWSAQVAYDGRLFASLQAEQVLATSVDGAPVAITVPVPPLARSRWAALSLGAAMVVVLLGGLARRIQTHRLLPDTLVTAAGWALDEGRPRQASRWARRVLARDAAARDAAVLHVVALYRQGRHDDAVAWLRDWMDRHGDDPELDLVLGLGLLHSEGGRAHEEATAHVARAFEEDPSLRAMLAGV